MDRKKRFTFADQSGPSSSLSSDDEIFDNSTSLVSSTFLEFPNKKNEGTGVKKNLTSFNDQEKSFTTRRESTASNLISSDEGNSSDDNRSRFCSHFVPNTSEISGTSDYKSTSLSSSLINEKNAIINSSSENEDPDKTLEPTEGDTTWDPNSDLSSNDCKDGSDDSFQNLQTPHKMKNKAVLISSDEGSGEENNDSLVLVSIDEPLLSGSMKEFNNEACTAVAPKDSPKKMLIEESKNTSTKVISIDSEDEVDVNKVIDDMINLKDSNLKAERRRLELEARDVTSRLESLKTAYKSMNPEKLPDKGAKLRRSMEKSTTEIKIIDERLAFIDKQIKATSGGKNQKELPFANKLPTASSSLSELGKKALETHNIQSALTVETLERMHKSLEKQPTDFSTEPKSGLKVELLPHQKYGLGWALWRESQKPVGGILADDMGLGKTLTMISLILHKKVEERKNNHEESSEEEEETGSRKTGGTLVISPSSVMGQWENEIKSKVVRGKLSCLLYHGPNRRKIRGISDADIVLSTYATIMREDDDSPLMKILWKRIILDEAHNIRNANTKTARAVFALKGQGKWALTGTPVQNKEIDLYAILKFLRCKPFNDLAIWKKWVDNKDAAGVQRLNCILKAILLRRTKEGIQSEGGLESLQMKLFNMVTVSLDAEEYDIYKKVAYFSKTLLGQLIKQKAEKENLMEHGITPSFHRKHNAPEMENPFKNHPELEDLYRDMMTMDNVKTHQILVLLLRLRQICCHPSLAVSVLSSDELTSTGIETNDAIASELVERINRLSIGPSTLSQPSNSKTVFDKKRCSSKMKAVIDCITNIIYNSDDKLIVVSQWTSVLNILKEFLNNLNLNCTEFHGSIPVKNRPAIIEKFNSKSTESRIMLLSLAAGGTGLNLIGANHLLLIDIHWNPQLEAQACDRIYRVGQMKQVNIYKFVCSNTIEENIVELQKRKLELANEILTGSVSKGLSKLTLQDMKMLFNIK